jgi:2-haloacid dehalogenase
MLPDIDFNPVTTLTFDCFGTLIDWEAGVLEALQPLLVRHDVSATDDEIIRIFQDLEEPLCEPPYRPYSIILAEVVEGLGRHFGFPVRASDRDLLAASISLWRPFPDTVEALRVLSRRFTLAIISNIDDDMFVTTARQLAVPFDAVITAEQTRCYKPHQAIFEEAIDRLKADPSAIAHIAEGVTEIAPMRRFGCATVWVRRNGRSAHLLTHAPDLEVPNLNALLPHAGLRSS